MGGSGAGAAPLPPQHHQPQPLQKTLAFSRDVGAGVSGAGAMWIDFVLLPHRLDEHLEALRSGILQSPTATELVNMFLEQAVANYKLVSAGTVKDATAESSGASRASGRTASVLCEKAVKVVIAMRFSLSEIETFVMAQHQLLLLKALAKFDKERLLMHQCNLHRWIIRRPLRRPHKASSMLRSTLRNTSSSSFLRTSDFDEIFSETAAVANGGCPVTDTEEEQKSLEFLERILQEERIVNGRKKQMKKSNKNEEQTLDNIQNGIEEIHRPLELGDAFMSQVMFDVAETHFMQGRIRKAHEMFDRCGQMVSNICSSEDWAAKCTDLSSCNLVNGGAKDSFLPQDRLTGFIIACRALVGSDAVLDNADIGNKDNHAREKSISKLFAQFPAQQLAFDCEQHRGHARKLQHLEVQICDEHDYGSGEEPKANGFIKCINTTPESKVQIMEKSNFRSQLFLENGISPANAIRFCNRDPMNKVDYKHLKRKAGEPNIGPDDIFLGNHYDLSQEVRDDGAVSNHAFGKSLKKAKVIESVGCIYSKRSQLVQVVAEDILQRHLSSDYCLSLERDPSLPITIRSQLAACNVLRSVLEGGSFESFFRLTDQPEDMKDAYLFLLELMGKVKFGWFFNPNAVDKRNLGLGFKSRIHNFARYVCCMLGESVYWSHAVEHGLLLEEEVEKLRKQKGMDVHESADADVGRSPNMRDLDDIKLDNKRPMLLNLLQQNNLSEIESYVLQAHDELCRLKSLASKGNAPDSGRDYELTMEEKVHGQKGDEMALDCYHSELCGIASILQSWALTAMRNGQAYYNFANRLCELARLLDPKDLDTEVMLWLLEKVTPGPEDRSVTKLPISVESYTFCSSEIFEYTILTLIDKEMWALLSEFCLWGVHLADQNSKMTQNGSTYGQLGKELLNALELGLSLSNLLPGCIKLQQANSSDCITSVRSEIMHNFEVFLALALDCFQMNQSLCGTTSLLQRISNSHVLTVLLSLIAGWHQQCFEAKLTKMSLVVEDFGLLSHFLAGTSSVTASSIDSILSKISPKSGRNLFSALLERIIQIPTNLRSVMESGYRWFLCLADMAFEDESYLKALQLYLQAGAVVSSFYCERASSMRRDVFTPLMIRRMISACKEIGARIQAVVLCQCLPTPAYDVAFQILQASRLIVDYDATTYFECIWEVPILELLVQMHAKAGDQVRVHALINLLQQPALNVHNPASIRMAHIAAMEQRFLQRFYNEIL